ncbi:MAG: diguanylate cyclase [Alphaproteobacteria bacterium]
MDRISLGFEPMSMSGIGTNAAALANWIAMPDTGSDRDRRQSTMRTQRLAATGPGGWFAINCLVTLLYLGLGYAVATFFAAYGLFPAPIWLPSSVALVAAIVWGPRIWPALFIGSFIVNYALFDPPWHVAALISITNTLGPAVGAALTRRFRPQQGQFTRFSGVLGFILFAVLLHALIAAAGGTTAIALGQSLEPEIVYSIWTRWWLADSGGTLYFAPALLLWLGAEQMPSPRKKTAGRTDAAVWLGTAATAILLFATPLDGYVRHEFPFLLAVPLSWVALRMTLRSAYTLFALVAVIASAGTVAGLGPFQEPAVSNPLVVLGAMVLLFSMNVLTIAALACERYEAESALEEANLTLENKVTERTEELRRQAETDALTGVSNRRAFIERGQSEVTRAKRYSRGLAIIIVDLDHFKRINDNFGHATGDEALKAAARACAAQLRKQDMFGRIGGEEFAAILPETGLSEARLVAEKLRSLMRQLAVPDGGGSTLLLSASFGVAALDTSDQNLDQLMARADRALYRAKAEGRDRVETAIVIDEGFTARQAAPRDGPTTP